MTAYAAVAEDLPTLDYTDPALRGPLFHQRVRAVRAWGWLARTDLGAIVLDRESAEFFLRTRSATFPGLKIAELFGIADGPLADELRRNILCIDGEDHRRLRSLVNPAFTPRAAQRWRPVMREYLDRLWSAVPVDGAWDAVGALAKPYPALTIATVMGAPTEDAGRLQHWSTEIQKQFSPAELMAERAAIEQAVVEFYAYADELLAARRADPGDDLISQLLRVEAEGDRLSDVECVNLVLNALVGGVDTTQAQLAHAVRLFAEHPDQWDLVRADPALVPAAVTEVLRYEPITPFTGRILVEPVTHRGVDFDAGTVILVAAVAANRDGVPEPDEFRVDRGDAGRLLTFGAGVHYCLGVNLATAELQEALAFLAARVERFELAGEPRYGAITGVYGMEALPVRAVRAG